MIFSLRRGIDHAWRLLGTGLGFACFGIGGVVISLTLFPAIRLLSPDPKVCQRRIQRAMSGVMRLFIDLIRMLGVISLEVHGAERLKTPGQLVVANHPSLIDVVLLVSLMPQVDCVVKRSLWRNPFLRWPVSWAGYIPNTDPESLIETCAASLREGRSLLIFPEGTRSVPGAALNLKRGAAQIALAANRPIRPVRIQVEPLMLGKGVPWYRLPPSPGHFRLEVGEIIQPDEFLRAAGASSLAARHLTRHFETCFSNPAPSVPAV